MPSVRHLGWGRSLPSMRSAQGELGSSPSENRGTQPTRAFAVIPPRLSGAGGEPDQLGAVGCVEMQLLRRLAGHVIICHGYAPVFAEWKGVSSIRLNGRRRR